MVTESNGSTFTNYESVVETKAGEPLKAFVIMWIQENDGITTAEARLDGTVNA